MRPVPQIIKMPLLFILVFLSFTLLIQTVQFQLLTAVSSSRMEPAWFPMQAVTVDVTISCLCCICAVKHLPAEGLYHL